MAVATSGIPAARRPGIPGSVRLLANCAATHFRSTVERLGGSLLTAAGLGLVDVGAFEANPVAGWVVTGLSVLLLDWKLETPPGGDR